MLTIQRVKLTSPDTRVSVFFSLFRSSGCLIQILPSWMQLTARLVYPCVPLKTKGTLIFGGMAPLFGFGQAKLGPNPPQLWHVSSRVWASAMKGWPLAKLALGPAQRAWAKFCQIWLCAQWHLIHHTTNANQISC